MNDPIIARLHNGMQIHTRDGRKIGKIVQVWYGNESAGEHSRDDSMCSYLEVHGGTVLRRSVLYIPIGAVADVAAGQVMLSIDSAALIEHDWSRQPAWIAASDDAIRPDGIDGVSDLPAAGVASTDRVTFFL